MVSRLLSLSRLTLDQSTLADEFLADIEEEEAASEQDDKPAAPANGAAANGGPATGEDMLAEGAGEEEGQEIDPKLLDKLKSEDLKAVVKLLRQPETQQLLTSVKEKMSEMRDRSSGMSAGKIEDDPEYRLIYQANIYSVELGKEVELCHKWLRDHYKKRFQELESIVMNPVDFAKLIIRFGNETDLGKVNLSDILPPATVMAVSLTASTMSRVPFSAEELTSVMEAAQELLSLDDARRLILQFIESRMSFIAPNLSYILGSSVAAKLMTAAGGLSALSRLPAVTVQILGASKKHLSGMSASAVYNVAHAGFIFNCDIVQRMPPGLRAKAVRLVAGKCALAARVDAHKNAAGDATGKAFREQIEKTLDKLLEPPPAKRPKALPAPDDKPRKRRGGKRMRAIKEKYGMTDVRKFANRMAFAADSEGAESTYRETGKGYGMLGLNTGSGKVRINAQDKGLLKRRPGSKDPFGMAALSPTRCWYTYLRAAAGGTTSTVSGLATSLAFTPVQGIEFVDPERNAQRVAAANERYFGAAQSFQKKPKVDFAVPAPKPPPAPKQS
jgi:U4/U6 small nuclear ribonucleoprotein PRP31